MAVVAVYSLNDEFKSVVREAKNGQVSGFSYVLAKSILVLPILFIFSLFALGIPLYIIQDAEGESFGPVIILFACTMFVFESLAECLSVWFEDPILGMLQFMNFWFASFLFGGFLIALEDMYWPFEVFYYIMPYSYFVRSAMYEQFLPATFEPCFGESQSSVCTTSTQGIDVLNSLSQSFPLLSTKNYTSTDTIIVVCIGVVYKVFYIIGVLYKTSQVAKINRE
jgi:hypothetical protein